MATSAPGACPCQASFGGSSGGEHYVWLAFLRLDNDQYEPEQWLRDYFCLPTNRLTCLLTGSDLFHCQCFFWDQALATFVTFTVDAHHQVVHCNAQKQFRRGWRFLRLTVTQDQEQRMYAFLRGQADAARPFNWLGALLLLFAWPVDTGTSAWFCSQLDVAALHAAGLLLHLRPEATSPAGLLDALLRTGEVHVAETTSPVPTQRVHLHVQRIIAPVAAGGGGGDDERSPPSASASSSSAAAMPRMLRY